MFKKLIAFLNKMKHVLRNDEMPAAYRQHIRLQNPYGMIGLVISGFAFIFPQFGLSILTLVFCIVTYFTFDKETEDNPWPFYLGGLISLAGLMMFITGEMHQIVI